MKNFYTLLFAFLLAFSISNVLAQTGPSWDCVNGACIDPQTGLGQYSSLSACQSNCPSSTFVSTTSENKNIILEHFSGGINNPYAPDGDFYAQDLANNNPGDVFVITIHEGAFATPSNGGPDFQTSWGAAIQNQSTLVGWPSGTINRHQFAMWSQGGTSMTRADWSPASSQLLLQSSPVNVGLQSSIDMSTNTLTVDVQVYYTGSQTVTSNMLNIAVVQHNVEGPQSGGSTYNPWAILPNGNYNHNHMLRHMMTGQWGDQITTITQGSLYTNTYTWTMPADINGVILDPTNISIVAFVSEGNQEILSGTEDYPSLVFTNAYDANLISASAPDITCTTITDLTVDFQNNGSTNLTSLDIEYSVNGGSSTIYPWTGNLTSGATETVVFPNISFSALLTNTLDVSLVNPNGNTDQNPSNNNDSATFAGLESATPGNATIDITTDNYGDEITWELINENGTIIALGGPYAGGVSATIPTAYATINSGECYSFIIYDSSGNGILSPGFYMVKDAYGNIIASGGSNYTLYDQTNFESNG
ncbi:Omp28-related outer membrane protein, partial [Flavobacteriales bacterium]|nr:Omp28-related outer membrane protein [Flavobacteriales bacterium]